MALIVVSIAAASDIKTHKIPNKLTFPAAGLGIILQALYFASWSNSHDIALNAAAGALNAIIGWWVAVIIMSTTKLFMRKFGHGDTKLMAAVGSILGPGPVLMVYLYYSLCFGIFSLVTLGTKVPWQQFFMVSEMKKAGATGASVDMGELNAARKEIIPVAPFIALGTMCTLLLEKQTLIFFNFVD